MLKKYTLLFAPALVQMLAVPTTAVAVDDLPFEPYANLRYRLELVDQDGLPRNATASTLRIRAGVKTKEWHGLSAVVEGEAIVAIGKTHYNDTINGKTDFPVVADPEDVLLNQAYLRWKPDSAIVLSGGRQAVKLDNQRWIGSVGWRQNDQTLDVVRLTATPVKGLTLDYLYAWRVNRIFGPDSAQGVWHNNNIHGVRVGYAIEGIGTISAYGYWLDIPDALARSSRTLGVRFTGERPLGNKLKVHYAAEFARQHDYAGNPQDFSHSYFLIESGVSLGPATIKAGMERLGGDGITALQTPLATLHAFNGWADKFLNTPPNGLRDIYINASFRFSKNGPLQGSIVRFVWHDYRSSHAGISYGQEWDAVISYPVHKSINLLAKFAWYDADQFATNTQKIWFSVELKI